MIVNLELDCVRYAWICVGRAECREPPCVFVCMDRVLFMVTVFAVWDLVRLGRWVFASVLFVARAATIT